MKLQYVPDAALSDDLKVVARACERPAKRAKMTRLCKETFSTPLIAAFSALLIERDDLENRCEVLTLKPQCIFGLVADTKNLREKLADCEKTDATANLL